MGRPLLPLLLTVARVVIRGVTVQVVQASLCLAQVVSANAPAGEYLIFTYRLPHLLPPQKGVSGPRYVNPFSSNYYSQSAFPNPLISLHDFRPILGYPPAPPLFPILH